MPIRTVCWLRRDLRLEDNAALWHALVESISRQGTCLPVFVFDREILDLLPDRDDRRVAFLWEAVSDLRKRLATRGRRFLVLHARADEAIPALATTLGGGISVHAAHDQEPRRLARDARVRERLAESGSTLTTWKDATVFERDEVLSGAGTPFRVWTPFRKAWGRSLESNPEALDAFPSETLLEGLAPLEGDALRSGPESLSDLGFQEGGRTWSADAASVRERVREFEGHLDRYDLDRDVPALEGTSRLSVDLRFGTVSVRELGRLALSRTGKGAGRWLDQLVWREFHQMLLWHFPESATRAFQTRYEAVAWDDPDSDPVAAVRWEAWCEGRTGYPLVDAALRQLLTTGWMHNRLRMVVASFLTKDLHLHWRLGERFFARHLLDYDMAQNVGGWQWAASTGADGQPWFRVFHPCTQGERWDPQGAFVRRFCPQLDRLASRTIHAPWTASKTELDAAGVRLGANWPHPVVDHAAERIEALRRFREASAAPG